MHVRVSDIGLYLRCPRLPYFYYHGHSPHPLNPLYVKRLILKELAHSYPEAVLSQDVQGFLRGELERTASEIDVIHPELSGVSGEVITRAQHLVWELLPQIEKGLNGNKTWQNLKVIDTNISLVSERLGLAGVSDRLVELGGRRVPSVIKTGNLPRHGVWRSDRVQLAAHVLLLEEAWGERVEGGFVEYAAFGEVREAVIKYQDRRAVLHVRNKIRKIQKGVLPERPADAPCKGCNFRETCEVKPTTLASKFF